MSCAVSDQTRLAVSMNEKRPKKDTISDFMEQVDKTGAHLPTMEELAGTKKDETNLLSQIDQEETKLRESVTNSHRSNKNRTGATLQQEMALEDILKSTDVKPDEQIDPMIQLAES